MHVDKTQIDANLLIAVASIRGILEVVAVLPLRLSGRVLLPLNCELARPGVAAFLNPIVFGVIVTPS